MLQPLPLTETRDGPTSFQLVQMLGCIDQTRRRLVELKVGLASIRAQVCPKRTMQTGIPRNSSGRRIHTPKCPSLREVNFSSGYDCTWVLVGLETFKTGSSKHGLIRTGTSACGPADQRPEAMNQHKHRYKQGSTTSSRERCPGFVPTPLYVHGIFSVSFAIKLLGHLVRVGQDMGFGVDAKDRNEGHDVFRIMSDKPTRHGFGGLHRL